MKKILRIAVLFAIALAIVTVQSGQLEINAAAEDVTIDMKVGFDKFYKIGYATPVYFEIENRLRDINGELQLEIPDNYDSITIYAMNVSLPKDSTKKLVMNVPMEVFNTKLKVNLVEGKNTISTKSFRIDPGSSMDTYAIGILSDDYDSLKYINKMTVPNYGNFSTKNVRLDEGSFPVEVDVLKAFNVIVINNFDTSRLSSAQYEALKKWVEVGGLLVIGTGSSQSKTLSIFKDDFITGEVGEIRTIQATGLHKLAGSKTIEAMSIGVLDIDIKGSTAVLTEGPAVLLQKLEKGRGAVAVAAFDFGMEPLSTWVGNSAFAEKAISNALPAYYQSELQQKGMMPYDNIYAIDNALRNIPELPLPKTSHLIFLYAAYIILAAPLSYFLLKRMDKRELMWLTVPVLSIVFSGVIYVSGVGTRLTEPVTNIISLVDIDNSGAIVPKTYAGIFTPNKDSMKVEAGEDFGIKPLNINRGYYYGGPVTDENSPKRIDSKVIVSPKTVLEFYDNGIWSMRTLNIESEKVLSGKLESSLNYAKGAFTGTIKNTSGFDLDECYLITPNQYADIGPIKNGETKQINIKPSSYFGNRYDLVNAIYRDPYTRLQQQNQKNRLSPEEITRSRSDMQKRQILEYGFMNQAYQGFEAKLIAWSSTPVAEEILVNGKSTQRYEKSFITSKVELSFRDGDSVEYPLGFLKPIVVNNLNSGNYDEFGRMFYGRGSVEVHYKMDSNIKVESVKTQYTVGNQQRVRQYIWDVQKNDWIEGDYRSFDIYGDLLERYIDGDGMLKLKFEMDDDNVQLPLITVKGSVK